MPVRTTIEGSEDALPIAFSFKPEWLFHKS
jgi:hypothetical protein